MYRIDDEFLLLSRGGRVSAGSQARWRESARAVEQRARHELALREGGVRRTSLVARVRARLSRTRPAGAATPRRTTGAGGRQVTHR